MDKGAVQSTSPVSPGQQAKRNWRRKWKRAPQASRLAAALALGDALLPRKSAGRVLLVMLAISLVLHVAGVVLVSSSAPSQDEQTLAAKENDYLQKIVQKERAKNVSRGVAGRITMPPEPPDPEGVVTKALEDSLASDVDKITGKLLDVKLRGELANYVKTNLRDELASAAKDIAGGKITESELKARHQRFQEEAHRMASEWRSDYMEKHQVERAAVSTTDWYEQDVSRVLVNNMRYALFPPPNVPTVWGVYTGGMARGNGYPTFSASPDRVFLHWQIGFLLQGKKAHDAPVEACWPGPNKEQAEFLLSRLKPMYEGSQPDRSWEAGFKLWAREYFPHWTPEDIEAKLHQPMSSAWQKVLSTLEAYKAKADAGAASAELTTAKDAAFSAINELLKAMDQAGKQALSNWQTLFPLNVAIRTQVLRTDLRDKNYQLWVDKLIEGLDPMIRDFAKGQFKKGIIKADQGVEAAMKDFPNTILPLLRRDMERLIPKKEWDSIVHQHYQHSSKITGKPGPPDDQTAAAEAKKVEEFAAKGPHWKAFIDTRRQIIEKQFKASVEAMAEDMLTRVLTGNMLYRDMGVFVEGVDYADKVKEKLDARAMALKGRGQDMAKLTEDGVPDTSAPLVALMLGAAKGHGANLEPVPTGMRPGMFSTWNECANAVVTSPPRMPRLPARWGFEEQPQVKAEFPNCNRLEGIPFLPKFPRLDGDLSDWGKIRPLILRPPQGKEAILLYAAWNYQGFFFGYEVKQADEAFYWPSFYRTSFSTHSYVLGASTVKQEGTGWAFVGDHLNLMFDTLDARNELRGENQTQEFVIFPRGTSDDPTLSGIERMITSQRDASRKEYRQVKDALKVFPAQPPPDQGPDGLGPYRVTRAAPQGYTTEVFLPRSVFNMPVFAPGWYIGFDCQVGTGVQRKYTPCAQQWATGDANAPQRWGDLLMLGTDPKIILQEATDSGAVARGIIPGHSYLLTVVDPDRNVHPDAIDTVLVSAEVVKGTVTGVAVQGEPSPVFKSGDVEVFMLRETKENSGVFRGYIDTQPGVGRQVQGVLELMPLNELRLGYVDFANARGQRNLISEMRLPVLAPLTDVARK